MSSAVCSIARLNQLIRRRRLTQLPLRGRQLQQQRTFRQRHSSRRRSEPSTQAMPRLKQKATSRDRTSCGPMRLAESCGPLKTDCRIAHSPVIYVLAWRSAVSARFAVGRPRRSLPPVERGSTPEWEAHSMLATMPLGDCRFNRGISFQLVIAFKKQGVFFN